MAARELWGESVEIEHVLCSGAYLRVPFPRFMRAEGQNSTSNGGPPHGPAQYPLAQRYFRCSRCNRDQCELEKLEEDHPRLRVMTPTAQRRGEAWSKRPGHRLGAEAEATQGPMLYCAFR